MANPKGRFPQILPANWRVTLFSALLWATLTVFFIANFYAVQYNSSKLSRLLLPALTNPFSIAWHVTTAKNLWDSGYRQTATRELVIAADLVTATGSVLGATSNPTTLLTQWESEPSKLKASYDYWKSVITRYPDFRDGFLTTASYAYQLGDVAEAKQMVEKAYALDPNYALTIEMLKKIEK